ncbi:MAG: Type 1 glutamine amidotransferase-like domain-containing protein [Candidatus Shapirobacteria bacterium]|nr:Type 1 glutamine amidotransferase-like domain-containing protein [Candidatus Shapirobacteria bacterium]
MKLLLTSGGISNQTIIDALKDLAQKPFDQLNVAFIPTAANLEAGDKWWLIKDLQNCKNLGFAEIDIVDISALPKEVWLPRLNIADIIMVGGGNTYHLMYWFYKSGLSEILPDLLKTKVYVGISAGSLVVTPSIVNANSEKQPVIDINETIYDDGLGLVDFMVEPHINNSYFPELNFDYPVYAIDDNSAIKIDNKNITIVSEGQWKLF